MIFRWVFGGHFWSLRADFGGIFELKRAFFGSTVRQLSEKGVFWKIVVLLRKNIDFGGSGGPKRLHKTAKNSKNQLRKAEAGFFCIFCDFWRFWEPFGEPLGGILGAFWGAKFGRIFRGISEAASTEDADPT